MNWKKIYKKINLLLINKKSLMILMSLMILGKTTINSTKRLNRNTKINLNILTPSAKKNHQGLIPTNKPRLPSLKLQQPTNHKMMKKSSPPNAKNYPGVAVETDDHYNQISPNIMYY